jgi:AraC-like DNA-binding protein
VLSRQVLLDVPGLRIAEVHCPGDHARWSSVEQVTEFGIVLPRRGVFRRRVDGCESLVDPATGYLHVAGSEQQIAHPAGGDVCTSITLAVRDGDPAPTTSRAVHVSTRLSLAHRLLVSRARAAASAVELSDLAIELATAVLAALPVQVGTAGATASSAHKRLVDDAREVLAADPTCALPEIAERLAVSPYHLSRVFHRTTGTTLRRYRIRLRTVAALDALASTEPRAERRGLAALAAELGFADQAHLTRTLRAETGEPPGRLRELLRR